MSAIKDAEKKMHGVIEHFQEELKGIRTGRANPSMLEHIEVEVYGSKMRLRDIASVNAPEPRQLIVTPYDPSNVNSVAKGIDLANLGFKCGVDAGKVFVTIPEMNMDTRKKMSKQVEELLEKTKVGVRHVRRESIDSSKQQGHSEDEERRHENEIQKLTNRFCEKADELAKQKITEVMSV